MGATMLATRPLEWERRSPAVVADQPVLVVDEDPGVRDLVRFILEAEGMTVETAENGYQGLARGLYRRPSLVILDLGVAFIGAEVIVQELRATYGDALPVILMSHDANVREVAHRIGADDCLAKPFSWNGVLGAVKSTLVRVGNG